MTSHRSDRTQARSTSAEPPIVHPHQHRARLRRVIARISPVRRAGKYWHQLGPGLTTGAADDDPSGIATYSQTGSQFGTQLLWMAGFTFPLMAVVQEMCARIGLVTGRGLAANIRLRYPRWVLYACTGFLFVANTFNIGADLGAMASAMKLLTPEIRYGFLLIAFTVVSLLLQVFTSYATYARVLKWLALVLLAYVVTALTLDGVDWGSVIRSAVVPSLHLTRDQIILICGILGTTISPYLFFWQTSQEVEQEILEGERTVQAREQHVSRPIIRRMRMDVWSGMFFSNLVMFFIIVTTAMVLHRAGLTTITTAAEAAEALRPLAGSATFALFALGIIGIGLLAVPVLAGSAAYALAESFHWREGLYRKLKDAYAFYGVIAVATVIGLLLNFIGLDPMKALLIAAVVNGLVAPLMLFFVIRLGSDRRVMGQYVNGRTAGILGWLTFLLMAVVAVATVVVLR